MPTKTSTHSRMLLCIYILPCPVKAPSHVPLDLHDSSLTQARKMQPWPVHFAKEEARCKRVKGFFLSSQNCLNQEPKSPKPGPGPGLFFPHCQTQSGCQSPSYIYNHISQKPESQLACHHLLKGPLEAFTRVLKENGANPDVSSPTWFPNRLKEHLKHVFFTLQPFWAQLFPMPLSSRWLQQLLWVRTMTLLIYKM